MSIMLLLINIGEDPEANTDNNSNNSKNPQKIQIDKKKKKRKEEIALEGQLTGKMFKVNLKLNENFC